MATGDKLIDRTELLTPPQGNDIVHVLDVSDTTDSSEGTSKYSEVDNFFGDIPEIKVRNLTAGSGVSFATATTNRTTINTAITDLQTAGGGTIVIPSGTYVIDRGVDIVQGVSLKGMGKYNTMLMIHEDIDDTGSPSVENVINIDGTSLASQDDFKIRISDIRLNFNIDNILATGTYGSDWQTRINGAALDNIGNCIRIRGNDTNNYFASDITVENCILEQAAFHGLAAYERSKNLRILNCESNDNYYRAFHVHGKNGEECENIIVKGNICNNNCRNTVIDNGGIFVAFHRTYNVIVTDNIVTNDGGMGFAVNGALAGDDVSERVIVSNNISTYNEYGMSIGGGANESVYANNVVTNNTNLGVEFSGTNVTNNNTFTGNVIENNGGRGLYIKDVQYLAVTGNIIKGNNQTSTGGAVEIEDSKYVTFTGNQVMNNGNSNFTYQLRISATAANDIEWVNVVGNLFESGTATANPIIINGGTQASPNSYYVNFSNNTVQRTSSPTGTVIVARCQSSIISNNLIRGTITDDTSGITTLLIEDNDQEAAVKRLNGNLNLANLPTSASGLNAGDLWNNSGVVNIV